VVKKFYILWEITQCSPLEVNRRFRGTLGFHLPGRRISKLVTWFTLVSLLAYFSTLKMEATCYSETSVEFQPTTKKLYPRRQNSSLCLKTLIIRRKGVHITNTIFTKHILLSSLHSRMWHLCEHHCVITQWLLPCASADSGEETDVPFAKPGRHKPRRLELSRKIAVLIEGIKVARSISRSINKYTVVTGQDTVKIYHID
jgi:hypothetical protein